MAGFKKAVREQVWLKVLLSGPSGSGKSYSALRLAKGIADKTESDIAYIGTEGSRNKYYAGEFSYDLLELEEPYTPEKYIEAIDNAVASGYKVLIIDSLSHEWREINKIHDSMPGNSFTNWSKIKPRHQKMMDKILTSGIHIISTVRGKDEWVLEDRNGKQVPKKVGMGSQQDKDISFEYTVSLMISQDTHIASADKDNTHLFDGRYDVLTEKDGEKLYEWANAGDVPTLKPVKEESYSEAVIDDATLLSEVKKEIVALCTQLGGTKNTDLMTVLKTFTSNGNPNGLRNLEKAKECLTAVKNVKPVE